MSEIQESKFVNNDPRLLDTIFYQRGLLYLDPQKFGSPVEEQKPITVGDRHAATLVTSTFTGPQVDANGGYLHQPLFDIDIPIEKVRVLESASGNSHLYINKPMTWEDYIKLMRVMVEVGLLQHGWVEKSIKQGCGRLRLPGVPKAGNTGQYAG